MFSSCSGDDKEAAESIVKNPQGTVTIKIDGVTKIYNTITVEIIDYVESYSINCTASQNGSSSEMIQFGIQSEHTGADKLYNFIYTANGHSQNLTVSSNISANNKNTLKGTFSGQVFVGNPNTGEGDSKPMTEGEINISY